MKEASPLTEKALEQINALSLRPLKQEEVYCFSVVLCDNDIDRDYERFDKASLTVLAKLFVGKTGIFDHDPKSANQTARIYDCAVCEDSLRKCEDGAPYLYLKASAYMVRAKATEDLILAIDAGIKKEVSIGCSVAKSVCSICGKDRKETPCSHIPGKSYGDKLCFLTLKDPLDAYEWSFVAVPAQRRAGVVKQYHSKHERSPHTLLKSLALGKTLTLSAEEAAMLSSHVAALNQEAALGKEYLADLRGHVRALWALCGDSVGEGVFAGVVEKMDASELRAFEALLSSRIEKRIPLQLSPSSFPQKKDETNQAFLI